MNILHMNLYPHQRINTFTHLQTNTQAHYELESNDDYELFVSTIVLSTNCGRALRYRERIVGEQ